MKYPTLGLVFAAAFTLTAQDPAAMANMQMGQQQQMVQQQPMTLNDQAYSPSANITFVPGMPWAERPSFSIPQGKVKPGTMVRIWTRSHYAQIYYTTDGWTPTFNSKLYSGPVEIDQNTILQAIAYVPNMNRSLVSRAIYITGNSGASEESSVNTAGVLPAGTILRLVTNGQASTDDLEIGDTLPLKLDEDIMNGDTIVVPNGTPVNAHITLADRSDYMGQPGDLEFQVDTIHYNQITIPVVGSEYVEGVIHNKKMIALIFLPGGGIPAMLSKGGQAVIVPGMKLNVTVTDDAALFPELSTPLPHTATP